MANQDLPSPPNQRWEMIFFLGGGKGVWGGGGGDGGLLFHFILSKIVSPASRRHWSLMHDGKLIRQDTSLKNQTKTIKNLHG